MTRTSTWSTAWLIATLESSSVARVITVVTLVTIWTIVVSRRVSLVTTTWRKYKICQYNNTVYRWVNKFLHASQHVMCRTRKKLIQWYFVWDKVIQIIKDTAGLCQRRQLRFFFWRQFFVPENFFCQQVFHDVSFHCKSIYVCI